MSKKTILVVDCEIGALTLFGIMFERGGFRVLKAVDAQMALEILDRFTPSLMTTDIMMPGMDGLELCRILRKRPHLDKMPILIISARGDKDSFRQGMEAGANDYLSKPILHHDLVAKARMMLAQPDAIEETPLTDDESLYLGIGQWSQRPITLIFPALDGKPEYEWETIILQTLDNPDAPQRGRALIAAIRWYMLLHHKSMLTEGQTVGWEAVRGMLPKSMQQIEDKAESIIPFARVLMVSPEATKAGLLRFANDPNLDYRKFGLRALLADRAPEVLELGIQAVKDADTGMRSVGIAVLDVMGTDAHEPLLLDVVRQDTQTNLRQQSAKALLEKDGQAIKDLLAEMLLGDTLEDTKMAAKTLAENPHPALENTLIKTLEQNQDKMVLSSLVDALGKLKTEAALDALRLLLEHSDDRWLKYTLERYLKEEPRKI